MENGSVYEYEAPVPGKYDTTKSYLIENNVVVRKYMFKSIKSRLRVRAGLFFFLKEYEIF